MTNKGETMDQHGNINATEGVDRCLCGCKYWESDHCVDCHSSVEAIWLRRYAADNAIAGRLAIKYMGDNMAISMGLDDYDFQYMNAVMASNAAAGA